MMNRGIVMEMDSGHVVVMTPDGEFKRVRVPKSRHSYLVGEEIRFPARQNLFLIPFRSGRFAISAAVILFIIVFSTYGLFGGGQEVVAYVTMDINPSVELGIDAGEHVIEVKGLNEDGQKLVKGLHYKGKSLDEVTRDIIEQARQQKYLAKANADIIITSTVVDQAAKMNDKKIADALKQQVNQLITADRNRSAPDLSEKIVVKALPAPKEVRDEAVRKGISTGKMAIKLIARKKAENIPIEQLKTHSIHDVVETLGGIDKLLGNDQQDINEELKQIIEEEKKQQDGEKEKRNKAVIDRQQILQMPGGTPFKFRYDDGEDSNKDTGKAQEQNGDNGRKQSKDNRRNGDNFDKPSNSGQEIGNKNLWQDRAKRFRDFWNQKQKQINENSQNPSNPSGEAQKTRQRQSEETQNQQKKTKSQDTEEKRKDTEVKKKSGEVKGKDNEVKNKNTEGNTQDDQKDKQFDPFKVPGISIPDFGVSGQLKGEPAQNKTNDQKTGTADLKSDKSPEKADKPSNKQTGEEKKQQPKQQERQQNTEED
ncbi:anti-sigma-I factor RsgI family protein [Ferviditalea candida]|uniref:Anti-sigma factor domain-containing protein n=1 Tax=Ferviditalea candida TaxID=3108399 RepID=A0ABU5ZEW4_9BACL|nr:anti-sigma factor domain-containing protein [Paenibacillaceae bacterium T2]